MPPAPEIRNAGCLVGVVKVFREVEAQHLAQADGHIGVAGEIEINLEGVCQNADPGSAGGKLSQVVGFDFRPEHTDAVGQDHLLGKAADKGAHTLSDGGQIDAALVQLPLHIRIPDDGPGNQLGEHGYIGAEVYNAFLYMNLAAVQVDTVGHALEGVEGNTDGQCRPLEVKSEDSGEKAAVFKDTQQSKAEYHRKNHNQPAPLLVVVCPFHQPACAVIDEDTQQHIDHVHRLAPGIENQTGQEQNTVFQLLRREEIDDQKDRQKVEQEYNA